jgi:hypothetical protein
MHQIKKVKNIPRTSHSDFLDLDVSIIVCITRNQMAQKAKAIISLYNMVQDYSLL